ncbi:GNAT family N-acetyltransferase [Mucilaginibacter sp. 14171R-50]|uniref:GNAT family N-acetyltransferase n=1 Tax=Mucilaginibacter sp. 14171R-50 TaxID=2703789 RepID=UPI00138BDB18|nr:GNAT family N-acetyltransferase [Mucilaginibacter sp. 14171R-50]QHS57604.1 GNAT family N-acetyltransferase [Mucilaginibacter sp. 14171R-50]
MLTLNLHPSPALLTARLKLRAVTTADAEDLFNLRSTEEVRRYTGIPRPASVSEVEGWIKAVNEAQIKNQSILWAITLRGSDSVIGTICYWHMQPENYRAEIGYILSPLYHRKGLMTEALTAVIQYGFEVIKLHSIEANTSPANLASIKVLEKTGFVREGYFKENLYSDGKFLDSAVYSLICAKK